MTITLRLMKMLKAVRKGFALLLISLIVMGCAGLKPFPVRTLIEYDNKFKVCGMYEIVDLENLKYEYVKDIPCPSVFGFSSKDVPKVLDWAKDAQSYAKQKCH